MSKHIANATDLLATLKKLADAVDNITYVDDDGTRQPRFKDGVDLNEYIGDAMNQARALIENAS